MEEASLSEMLVPDTKLHDVTLQKTVILGHYMYLSLLVNTATETGNIIFHTFKQWQWSVRWKMLLFPIRHAPFCEFAGSIEMFEILQI